MFVRGRPATELFDKGITLVCLGKYEEAIQCYEQAIEIDPNDAVAWSNKGITLGWLGKYEEAIKAADEAIRIDPDFAKAYDIKGNAFYELGRHDETLKANIMAEKIRKKKEFRYEQPN